MLNRILFTTFGIATISMMTLFVPCNACVQVASDGQTYTVDESGCVQ